MLMTDNEIINSILSGNRKDFRLLVEKYQQMIFRTCMGYVHNEEDANEITQDVFVSAYQHLSSFRQRSALSTWLFRIAVNASLNFLRSNKKPVFRFDAIFGKDNSAGISLPDADLENPEQILISTEQKKLIQSALDGLPDKQKTAFILSKYDNLSQKEIAEILDTTEGAVESLIQRAKANLQKKLGGYFKKNIQYP
ncbi:MAG: sigma-70 family RNA polymerase sigma factor [Bacteroidales bacterium]|nr:sigma-70 family RNA polymerase sigma factor [Bacteroidales bacterium]